MTLKEFVDQTRAKIVDISGAAPPDYTWTKTDAWKWYDAAIGQMLYDALPKSIELDPE